MAGSKVASTTGWYWRDQPVEGGSAVIFDVDGVLANADARQHLVTGPNRDWKAFFAACGTDSVMEDTAALIDLFREDIKIILLTGRPVQVNGPTVQWLLDHNLKWDLLIMRDRGDYAASLEFKRQAIRKLRSMDFKLYLAFEDDQVNREMFKEEGVPCMYVHSGYYETRDAEQKAGK